MKERIVAMLYSLMILLFLQNYAMGFDDQQTHPAITKTAVEYGKAKFKEDLIKKLGFHEGIETRLPKDRIIDLLIKGSTDEDKDACRRSNHMHNPLKAWSESYMTDEPWGETATLAGCKMTPYPRKYSNITWAFGQYMKDGPVWPREGQAMGWDDARYYFANALRAKTNSERETYYAKTFQSLGHVLHLLQDMAVPAHTRNDFLSHLKSDGGLLYVALSPYQPFERFVKRNSSLITGSVSPSLTSARPADYWDTDTYSGVNPSTSLSIGLAEFSNPNYFSDSTIPSNKPDDKHKFPYPKVDSANYHVCEDNAAGSTVRKKYVSRNNRVGCDHFAAINIWTPLLYKETNSQLTARLDTLKLHIDDDNVHNTYAKELLPRAVGYSAGLLNYFFRGDIRLEYVTSPKPGYVIANKTGEDMDGLFQIFYDNPKDLRVEFMNGNFSIKANSSSDIFSIRHPADAKEPGRYILVFKGKMGNEEGAVAGYVTSRMLEITPPEQFIYSMVDASETVPQLKEIKVKIKNATNELMQNGTLQAIVKYKKNTDDPNYLYSISALKSGISLTSAAQEMSFDFSNNPIPVDVTDLYLEVIFRGTIGSEQGAGATGIKDISEPTPIDIFNNTDKNCINGNWHFYADAIAAMDSIGNNNGRADEGDIYPHMLKNIHIKVSSPENPLYASPTVKNFTVPELDAGQFRRAIFILTDIQFKYSFNTIWEIKDSNDWWGHSILPYIYSGTAVQNQTDYTSDPAVCGTDPLCYSYGHSGYYSIRGNDMWWGGGVVFVNASYPANSSCQGY